MASRAKDTPVSEGWFDCYVRSHGHDPGSPEPELGVAKNPDRLISWNGISVVCEIKQFDRDPFDLSMLSRVRTLSMRNAMKPVRKAISRAASQLKPLADRGWPLVVVLANPRGMPVPFSSEEIIWALYGDPVWKIAIDPDTGKKVGETRYGADRNGQIRNRHQYLSAVVALRHRTLAQDWSEANWARLKEEHGFESSDPEASARLAELALRSAAEAEEAGEIPNGEYFSADVFVTMSPHATPLSADVFDGERDSRWEFDEAHGSYHRLE
jgi:hypothetical protein